MRKPLMQDAELLLLITQLRVVLESCETFVTQRWRRLNVESSLSTMTSAKVSLNDICEPHNFVRCHLHTREAMSNP